MKKKHDGGYTLIELLVSMVLLAAVVLPACTGLILSHRMNAKTDALLQAQLAVSTTVETLMAQGITRAFLQSLEPTAPAEDNHYTSEAFPDMVFVLEFDLEHLQTCYAITVMDAQKQVSVDTSVRCPVQRGGAG